MEISTEILEIVNKPGRVGVLNIFQLERNIIWR